MPTTTASTATASTLERLKEKLQCITTDQKDDFYGLTQPTTLSPILAILLDGEERQSFGPAENQPIKAKNPHEIPLALDIVNLVFRKLKAFRSDQHARALSPQVLDDISRSIWIHWNSPLLGLSYKLKATFKNLLDHISYSQIDISSCTQFFFEAIRKSILLEKRSLSILGHLVPLLPPSNTLAGLQVYAADPAQFLRILLDAIGDDKLASVLGQVALHWTTKVEGWQHPASKSIDSSASLRSDWIPITFSILFASEERKRQYLCQYYLLPLFKTRSQCFVELAEALPSIHQPQPANATTSSDTSFDYLSGLIALARISPHQDSTQSNKKNLDSSDTQLPDELLQVCLSHPAVSLRSSAFSIICQSTAPTSHLPSHYLDLVMHFFTYNFGLVEPELKQNISSNLNVLFIRLRDSSHSSQKKLAELIIRRSNQLEKMKGPTVELDNLIQQHSSYLGTVKSFVVKFVKLCRANLTVSSPYRCQMASLSYLLTLLNTGIDPLYLSIEPSSSQPLLQKQAWSAFNIKVIDQSFTNTLVLALNSTYVNVREAAFTILIKCSTLDSGFEKNSKFKQQISSYAIRCLNSKRESENCTASLLFRLILAKDVVKSPPSSITQNDHQSAVPPSNPLAAFLCGRLDDLEDRIVAAESDLGKACEERPIQGSIMLISELFKSLSKEMIGSLVASTDLVAILKQTNQLIFRVWKLSATILCYSSDQQSDVELHHEEARAQEFITHQNEGDLLDNEDVFQPGSHATRTETILSVCWRSMKEVSALLTQTVRLSLMAAEQGGACDGTVLSHQDLIEVGKLFEQWLLEIRHRGALGAIHSAYTSLCDSLGALSQDSASSKLPVLWLQAHVSAITNRKISTTRRSAGLPYCILSVCQALSRSDPNQLRESLNSIFDLVRGEEISSEAKVHILNTLKILLTDSKVSSQMSSSFIEMSYDLAIKSFVSPDWKVRNGALILFSGLTNRVFGTRSITLDRSHVNLCKRETFSDFFRRLPRMPSILLDELSRSIQIGVKELPSSDSQGPIFAVLSLLALLQNPDGAPAANEFIEFAFQCLQSKVSKIRSIGADAMTGLIPCREVPTWICDVLTQTLSSKCYNQIHGFLLLINRLIELPNSLLVDEKLKIQATVALSAPRFLNSIKAPLLCQSAFLEILHGLKSRFGMKLDEALTPDLYIQKIQKLHGQRAPGLNSYETQATKIILGQDKNQSSETVVKLLKEGYTATRLEVFRFLETFEHGQSLLNDEEISDLILSFASNSTHQVSIRQSALKLLGMASSNLNIAKWPFDELFKDHDSCQAVPIRNALVALSASILVNSLCCISKATDRQVVLKHWAVKILNKIEGIAQEDQSVETRMFAVNGLKEFLRLYEMDPRTITLSKEIKLKVLELCMNLIQDDDDEIRLNLIQTLHQTDFFFNINKKLVVEGYEEDEETFYERLRSGTVQLELVPNIILEKLAYMAVKLDPLFGFKRLLKIADLQPDFDQVMNLSSTDLFVTERLNLYKDDTLEFDFLRQASLAVFRQGDIDETRYQRPVQVKAIENAGIGNRDKVSESSQGSECVEMIEAIKTLKKLSIVLIPSLVKEEETSFQSEITSLFKIVYINNNDTDDEGGGKLLGADELDMIAYRSWFILMARLFHLFSIIKSVPSTCLKTCLLSFLTPDDTQSNSHPLDQLETKFCLYFTFVQSILLDPPVN